MAEQGFEGKQFGKYYILEKLAVGGMAEIYKAKTFGAEGFEKLLAIKRILPHAAEDKDFISMLIDEAKLSVLLSHANIVQVYDLGKVGNDYFISMEYIYGVNLRDILYQLREKNQKLPTELACYIASEVCKGLDYAHRKADTDNQPLGIVHRDISPQNILLSYEGEVKIVDFGIAKAAMNISHTMAGILKGKIAYMSPEQALGKTIDARTDIFSLGIVLYECLTGKKLFTGESQFEVLKKIRTTRIDANNLPPFVPAPLRNILAKTLAYHIEERFASAGDMQVALTKYLYATYTDFSPRKLANFVKELFQAEIEKEKGTKEKETGLEGKTGSISLVTGKVQEMIVHRETEPVPVGPEAVRAKLKIKRTTLTALVSLAGLIALSLFLWKFFTPRPESSLIAATLQVSSKPAGADIFINGEPTHYKTPAILENLKLKQNYLVGLALEGYGRAEKTVQIENAEPSFLNIPLSKNIGILSVISDPPGAAILVNGIATGKMTPATVEDLELGVEYRVTLSKPNYLDFEQPITLASTMPQKILASLKPMEVEAKGSLLLETDPPGAKIFLDGQDTGKVTPATLKNLETGRSFSFRFEKEDFQPLEKTIRLESEKPVAVAEKLNPIPKKEPPPLVANLEVKSNPSGAEIFLNGKKTGKTTPAQIEDLPVGKYTIRLAKKDFEAASQTVQIASAEPYSIELKLKEIQKVPTPPPQPKQEPEPKLKPTPTFSGVGNIQIASRPSGADVYINGERKGQTPVTIKTQAGQVKVLVTAGPENLPCKETITVRPGEQASLNCTMGPLYGKININSEPPRADVFFDGKKMEGKTPMVIKKVKRDAEHTLRIEISGYRPWVRAFDLKDSEAKSFNVELEKP